MSSSGSDAAVVTRSLSKVYSGFAGKRTVRALDTLSISVSRGEVFGLLGPNGAGKTTLLKILLAVVKPTSGEALLMNKSVSQWESRTAIGFLPENHRFPPFLTAIGALRTYGALSNLSDEIIRGRADALLEREGLSAWRNDRIKTFSKGMMQRLGIAQTLLSDPAILFLDEPTDGVDPIGRREIRDLLTELKNEGKTIFLNSHLLSEVELICDTVAILHKGRLIQTGSIADLTEGGSGFEIEVESPGDQLLESRLDEIVPESIRKNISFSADTAGIVSDSATIMVRGTSTADLNGWIDRLRADGIMIRSVRPHYTSLEAKFIQTITDRDDRAGIDAGGAIDTRDMATDSTGTSDGNEAANP